MVCPFCGYDDSKVIDSRPYEGKIRRRRECGLRPYLSGRVLRISTRLSSAFFAGVALSII